MPLQYVQMKNPWRISAGVVDAGFASLATFSVGIFAIRYFEPAALGSYALVFSAFSLVVIIPRELIFVPAEITAVSRSHSSRLQLLPRTLRLGLLPALFAALLVSLWSLAAPQTVSAHVVVALTVTAVACAFLSPLQDHLRYMLHVGGQSWLAALISMVQVVGTVGTILYMLYLDVPVAWIPFGSLAAANFLSLLTGGILLQRCCQASPAPSAELTKGAEPRFRQLVRSGRWLLLGGLCAPASVFVASVLVTHLAGAEALGYAEAARVVARPLPVLAMGLSAVLRPLSIEAAQKRQLSVARRTSRLYVQLMAICGLVYLAIAGLNVPWNPLSQLLPNAYTVTGLVAATIIAEILAVSLYPYRHELLGAGQELSLTRIETVAGALRALAGGTAVLSHAFAMPLGQVAMGLVRVVTYRMALRQVYGEYRPTSGGAKGDFIPAVVVHTHHVGTYSDR